MTLFNRKQQHLHEIVLIIDSQLKQLKIILEGGRRKPMWRRKKCISFSFVFQTK